VSKLLRFILSIALAAARSDAAHAAPAHAASAHVTRIETAIDGYVAPLRRLGVFDGVVLVARKGHVLARRSYGLANVELRVPNTPDQRFRIASLSKLFTAVAIGRLWERGTLDPQTPLVRFLPEFPKGDSITIAMLLDHQAGVPSINDLPIEEDTHYPNTLDDLIAHIEKQPLAFSPGSRTAYSNGNYAVLAKVLERASGKSYAEVLRDEVLRPLGLVNTGHEPDGFLLERRAYGYVPDSRLPNRQVPAPYQQMATKTGGGSLYSTADDLYRFAQAMFRDTVIRRATWEAVLGAQDSALTMTGRCPGYNSLLLRRVADDVTVVVLSNNYSSGMLSEMGRDLAALALGKPGEPPRYRSDLAPDAAGLAPLAGEYAMPAGAFAFAQDRLFSVRLEGGHLVAFAGGTALDVLIPQSEHSFLMRNYWSELTFDDAGSRIVYRPLYRSGEFTFTRGATP